MYIPKFQFYVISKNIAEMYPTFNLLLLFRATFKHLFCLLNSDIRQESHVNF